MLKPNIRGYPKSELEFSLSGWRLKTQPGLFILHRYPWRLSWVRQVHAFADSKPLLSRSGRAHVLIQAPSKQEGKLRNQKRLPLALLLAAILAAVLIAAFANHATPANHSTPKESSSNVLGLEQQKPSSASSLSADATEKCPETLNEFSDLITIWQRGGNASPTQIQLETQIQIGGVRSSTILLTCKSKTYALRVTEAFSNGQWLLKQTARLNN